MRIKLFEAPALSFAGGLFTVITEDETQIFRGSFKLCEARCFNVTTKRPFLLEGNVVYPCTLDIHPHNGGLQVIQTLPLDAYLAGVLDGEVYAHWPLEALKAQAIVARTYALRHVARSKERSYDVEATTAHQAFTSTCVSPSFHRAVRETAGQVLTYGGRLIDACYHSTCGGKTEASAAVWGHAHPYLVSRLCTYCRPSPYFRWKRRLRRETFSESELRQKLPSTRVTHVERSLKTLKFSGQGFGHGVGLCQWGACGMAKAGFTTEEILSHYYPGAELSTFTPKK